jgi:hypothetical protein
MPRLVGFWQMTQLEWVVCQGDLPSSITRSHPCVRASIGSWFIRVSCCCSLLDTTAMMSTVSRGTDL